MNTATATQIKYIETSLDNLNKFGIEIDLESILAVEFELELPSDISNGV